MVSAICSDAIKKVELLRNDFRALFNIGDSFKEVAEAVI
jgi:hypothetical protein